MYVEEVNEMHTPILDSIDINLDEEGTLDDDKHEIIDIYFDFPNMLSMHLMLTSIDEHSESLKSLSLELDIVPTMLDIAPLESYLPSLITIN